MPLCTLEIPRIEGGFSDLQGIAVCDKSLDLTLKGLQIPDPEDREYRVMVSDKITEPNISISFTAGSDEYGMGNIFNPSKEEILETARSIRLDPQVSESGIKSIVMEPWVDTTFIIRSDSKEAVQSILPVKFLDRTPEEVGEVRIKFALSPEKMKGVSVSTEGEPSLENQSFDKVGQETSNLIREILNLPEGNSMQIGVLPTHLAQTDISVEVDFPTISKPLLPKEREFIARSIEQKVLNSNSSTKEGSATIWVRQGKPDSVQN